MMKVFLGRVLTATTWIVVCVCSLSIAPAADYFVSPVGNDAAQGDQAHPFATLMKAQQVVLPGDTVWIRGGTYQLNESQMSRSRRGNAYVFTFDKSGEQNALIRYQAVAGEEPIFDFSQVKPPGLRVTAFFVTGSWLQFTGLTVVGVQVTATGHTQSICFDNRGSHNRYERLTARDGQAIGFWIGDGADNLMLNCDAYRNHDFTSEQGLGGNVDGFGFHAPKGAVGNVLRGCRAWFNSDDGFDFINTSEAITVEQCWAMYNGYTPDFKSLADGNGFKVGGFIRAPAERLPRPIPRHLVRHCLAVANKASGFYANHHPGGHDWLNNSAYRNRVNFNMLGRSVEQPELDLDGYSHLLRNNLGYKGRRELTSLNRKASDVSHNSFDLVVAVDDDDFIGLDESELMLPRGSNGELPKVDFMRLRESSELVDAGQDVGLPYRGQAPDLGAFETQITP